MTQLLTRNARRALFAFVCLTAWACSDGPPVDDMPERACDCARDQAAPLTAALNTRLDDARQNPPDLNALGEQAERARAAMDSCALLLRRHKEYVSLKAKNDAKARSLENELQTCLGVFEDALARAEDRLAELRAALPDSARRDGAAYTPELLAEDVCRCLQVRGPRLADEIMQLMTDPAADKAVLQDKQARYAALPDACAGALLAAERREELLGDPAKRYAYEQSLKTCAEAWHEQLAAITEAAGAPAAETGDAPDGGSTTPDAAIAAAARKSLAVYPPSKELVRNALRDFDLAAAGRPSLDGARAILEHLGAVPFRNGPNWAAGKLPTGYAVTVWTEAYNDKSRFGLRFGGADLKYHGSNDTYMTVGR